MGSSEIAIIKGLKKELKRMYPQNKKIKILYIHPNLAIGGAEELRLLTLKVLLQRNNYDIKVCCIERVGEIGEKIKDLGIEVFCLNKPCNPYNISTIFYLWQYILANRFDIVQTSLFNANFHGRIAAIMARVPIIFSEEHSEHYHYQSLKFIPYIWLDKILSKFTDRILCCSKNLMDYIAKLENIPPKKLVPLINTFNKDKLKVTRDSSEVRKELGLSPDNLIIGNVASLSHRKGQDILIKAFRAVRDRFPAAKLIFIGSEVKELKQRLMSLVDAMKLQNSVFFLGKKNSIADYFNIMDIFILSSRFEGIPLALLEAMYMRLPVVSTNVGGVSEVIINNNNGILVDPGDSESLSKAVIELLSNPEKRKGIAGEAFKTVSEKFNNDRYIKQLEALYSEVYKSKSGRFQEYV